MNFKLNEQYKSFIKFAIVGCINTAVDFITFTLVYNFSKDKLLAQLFGYSMGVINSFILNKIWTFNSRKQTNTGAQFIKFIFANIISLGVSLISLNILSDKFGMNVYAAKVITTIFLQIFNYVVYNYLIFRKDKGVNIIENT